MPFRSESRKRSLAMVSVFRALKLRCLISCVQANSGSPFRSRPSIGIQRCSAGGHRVILVLLLPHPRPQPTEILLKVAAQIK